MKVLWVSPQGNSEVAGRLLAAGHQVVGFGEFGTLDIRKLDRTELFPWCKGADLIVVDGPFPLVKTKTSYQPSKDALFFEELRRHYDKIAVGCTPTVDLLVGDARYARKWCSRLSLPHASAESSDSTPWSSGAWFHRNDIVPDGPYLKQWSPLFKAVGFRGWFEMEGYLDGDGAFVVRLNATWPSDSIPEGREASFLEALAQ